MKDAIRSDEAATSNRFRTYRRIPVLVELAEHEPPRTVGWAAYRSSQSAADLLP